MEPIVFFQELVERYGVVAAVLLMLILNYVTIQRRQMKQQADAQDIINRQFSQERDERRQLSARVEDLQLLVDSLQAEREALSLRAGAAERDVNNLKDKLNSLTATKDAEINRLTALVSELKAQTAALESRQVEFQAQIDTIITQRDEAQKQLENERRLSVAQRQELSAQQDELNALKQRIKEMELDLVRISSENSTLNLLFANSRIIVEPSNAAATGDNASPDAGGHA